MDTTNYFQAINPTTNEALEKQFKNTSIEELNDAVVKATLAFSSYRKKDSAAIAAFLEQIAEEIMNLGDQLITVCNQETGLPIGRLQGERGRTVNQLKLFATVVREGSWVDARIDTALPDRLPIPRPDIRHILIPLGPVAVFGASNFPLAFSTAGGDTASALASGCPVIVKGHEAHPHTSALIAAAILKAVATCNMPEGVFTLLQGNSRSLGEALVKHKDIKAVGFTGSFNGGKALFDYANQRSEPIPVYAEMGSTNPVFILPGALKDKAEKIAEGLVASIAMGVGQFCTSPGITFIENGTGLQQFYNTLKGKAATTDSGTMLTPSIKIAYERGLTKLQEIKEVEEIALGLKELAVNNSTIRIFKTTVENYQKEAFLAEENFGPSSIIIESTSKEQILDAARNLKGHLTATIFGTDEDFENYSELFDILELKVGRVLVNGYPTGVEVCHAMVHGGPFPATTAANSTSVGTGAIKRFVRPVCFQDFPHNKLPKALQNDNPLSLYRIVNGTITNGKIA
ncbi:aldehyde dehydrogenase (NADP(+)) [Flavobacterium sp. 14A]|uniref:aldehyde dehydrogenase (NADP(+)) n=1 Tax=Flavobacterium sp. 14A TaxID=2735896 RepID=UPI00156F0678|nr:aldehyde dehydrogenase (NADP(+)) [Flavobacterium sp. 14A]NRT10774.1 NADP-dependent aldehyde dehydrogenase [Flavobacterium sp. 14A]